MRVASALVFCTGHGFCFGRQLSWKGARPPKSVFWRTREQLFENEVSQRPTAVDVHILLVVNMIPSLAGWYLRRNPQGVKCYCT